MLPTSSSPRLFRPHHLPRGLGAGHGKIINISVSDTTMVRRGFTPYGPSRAATEALSHIMAADLAGTGIDVNLPRLRRSDRPAHHRQGVRRQPARLTC